MVQWPNTSGLGWPFMVASLSLFAVAFVLPLACRLWRASPTKVVHRALEHNTELRMLSGFMLILTASAIFAGVGWLRGLMIEAGEFGDLALFTEWTRWHVMVPNALAFCFGLALIIWDGMAGRAKHICLLLIALAALFWALGSFSGDFVIRWWWGESNGPGALFQSGAW